MVQDGARHLYYEIKPYPSLQACIREAIGQLLELRLAEANPLTGALKFELPDGDGGQRVEPRGSRPEQRRDGKRKHMVGQRGRPGNVRHQGRRK